jgi:hypothetical protein
MNRFAATFLGAVTLALSFTYGCGGARGPRDVGNLNPRSEFPLEGGGGPARPRDAGPDARVIAAPTVTGRKARTILAVDTRAIALDKEHVYFGDAEEDAVLALAKTSADKDAGAGPTPIARRAPMQGALAIDPKTSTLAWIANPGDTVLRVPASGGVAITIRDRGIFTHVAANGGDVFFTEVQGQGGVLTRVTGTTAARLASFEGTPRGLVVDDDRVYVATSSRIVSTTRARGEVTEIARGAGFASPQVEGGWVYVTAVDPASRARQIVRAKTTGSDPETVRASVKDAPIAVFDRVLYWFDAERTALMSLSLEADIPNRAPATVCEDPIFDHVEALAVDRDGAWVAAGSGETARIVTVALR